MVSRPPLFKEDNMENNKLMTPLFYNGSFNQEGHRMRAVFEREISDGVQTYRLWRSSGKPDLEYPRAENDKYILYVEINGYLAILGVTDFTLIDNCGFELAAKSLYGGKEKRGEWIDHLRESDGSDAVMAAIAKEREEIERYGGDSARQTGYIHSLLNERVSIYLKAKENGGQTFPDFTGALVMNDLSRCAELSVAYRAKRQAEDAARRACAVEKENAYCKERNQEAEQAVSKAIQIIRDGGALENETVRFYRSQYDSSTYSIVNYLMRLYQVDVPLRTQGWINEKLSSVTIRDGKCKCLQYLKSKGARCSQKIFECMDALIQAVIENVPEQAGEDKAA